jgi:HK97 gp10 family phage protein
MADGLDVKFTGLEELRGKLQELSKDIQFKGGRYALRKAAQVVRDAARANAMRIDDPGTSESIAKNITERWNGRLNKATGDLGFRIGVAGGAKGYAAASGEVQGKGKGNPGGDTFYWRFVEFGTKNAAARPFLRPAMTENTQAATDEFIKQYDKAAERAIRRAKKARE